MFESFGKFGHSSGFGDKPCIIVVDFCKAFTDPNCLLGSDFSKEIGFTKQLLDVGRIQQIPIVFTTVVYEPHFRDGGYFIKKIPALKVLVKGSDWTNIDERLERKEDTEPLLIKKFASSFFGTSLHSLLTSEGIDTTIIVGCTTSGCVRATVVDALQCGFRVVVPEECVGDRSASAHQANLYDIQTKYGDVVATEAVIQYLQQIK